MDFTFDMSQTPLIGRKVHHSGSVTETDSEPANSGGIGGGGGGGGVLLQRRSTSLSPSDSAVPGWKRPWLCQVCVYIVYRVRYVYDNGISWASCR